MTWCFYCPFVIEISSTYRWEIRNIIFSWDLTHKTIILQNWQNQIVPSSLQVNQHWGCWWFALISSRYFFVLTNNVYQKKDCYQNWIVIFYYRFLEKCWNSVERILSCLENEFPALVQGDLDSVCFVCLVKTAVTFSNVSWALANLLLVCIDGQGS